MNAISWIRNSVWTSGATAAPRAAVQEAAAPAQASADSVQLGSTAPPSPAPAAAPSAPPAPPDPAFEKRAASFARFTRNQAEAGFDVSLRLSPGQVRRLSDAQHAILARHGIKIDVAESHVARARPGASRLEQQLVQEENDRGTLDPSLYFVNNYVLSPRAVMQMGE